MNFSIIIPVYNVAAYLNSCLDSVCAAIDYLKSKRQCDVEVICIDDGSTDASGAILDAYAQLRDEMRIVHKENTGVGLARNIGIEKAVGDWVLFVDSDDEVTVDFLSHLSQVIDSCAPDAICFGFENVYRLGGSQNLGGMIGSVIRVDKNEDPVMFYRVLNTAFVWNACYKRKLINELRFMALDLGEDTLFSCAMLSRVNILAISDAKIYHYLLRGNSLAHKQSISVKQIEDCGISTTKRIEYIKQWEYYNYVKKDLYKLVVTTFIGQIGIHLQKVKLEEFNGAWGIYSRFGYTIFHEGQSYMPRITRWFGEFVFSHRFYLLWLIFMFYPWCGRVFLLKFRFVRKVRDFMRMHVKPILGS